MSYNSVFIRFSFKLCCSRLFCYLFYCIAVNEIFPFKEFSKIKKNVTDDLKQTIVKSGNRQIIPIRLKVIGIYFLWLQTLPVKTRNV